MKITKIIFSLIVPCLLVFAFCSCKTPEYNLGEKDNYRLGQSLLDAISRGENLTAKRLIKRGAPLNFRDKKDDWTPLIYAIYYDNNDIADYLIKAGANVNCKDNLNRTPLMFCAMNGDMTTMQLLIENDADLNATDNSGRTALTYATIYTEYHAAEYLAKLGYIPKDKPGNPGKGNKKPFIATDAKPAAANAVTDAKPGTPSDGKQQPVPVTAVPQPAPAVKAEAVAKPVTQPETKQQPKPVAAVAQPAPAVKAEAVTKANAPQAAAVPATIPASAPAADAKQQ
jgi:hypothetical protein